MKLAIVENDKKFIKIVEDKIKELGYDDVSAYSESQTYKDDLLKNHCQFDIVIMDIELDNDSGIDLTIETNRVLPFCQIIYLTSYIQYVSDVYETDHIYYINKVDFDKYFSKAINKAVTNIHKKQSEILSISWNKINNHPPAIAGGFSFSGITLTLLAAHTCAFLTPVSPHLLPATL